MCANWNDGLGTVTLTAEAITHSHALDWKALAWPIWAGLGGGAITLFWCGPSIVAGLDRVRSPRARTLGLAALAILGFASLSVLLLVPGAMLGRLPHLDAVWCAIIALWVGAGFLLSIRVRDRHPHRRWFSTSGVFAIGVGTSLGIVVDVWKRASVGVDVASSLGVVAVIAVAVIVATFFRLRSAPSSR
jgi:hypothetical protein